MGIPEKSALVVLVVVVTSIVTCALFLCREVPDLEKTLRPATTPEPVLPALVPAVIDEEGDAVTTQAAPALLDDRERPATQRWYRRRRLAPHWMMRSRETRVERAREAHVGRDDPPPELKVDLLRDERRRDANAGRDDDVR